MRTRVQPTIRGLSLSVMSTAVSHYDRHVADGGLPAGSADCIPIVPSLFLFLRPSTCWGRVILVLAMSQSHLLC
jgi:hypothetical protein